MQPLPGSAGRHKNAGKGCLTGSLRKYLRLLIVAGLVIAADQASKHLVISSIELNQVVKIIPGFLNLVHFRNPGGAFGFFSGSGFEWRGPFFIIFTLAAVSIIVYLYRSTPERSTWLLTGFSLIAGGALGNLVDRLRFGQVVDFIDLYAGRFHWPAFNVADSAITVGMLIFVYYLAFKKYPV